MSIIVPQDTDQFRREILQYLHIGQSTVEDVYKFLRQNNLCINKDDMPITDFKDNEGGQEVAPSS